MYAKVGFATLTSAIVIALAIFLYYMSSGSVEQAEEGAAATPEAHEHPVIDPPHDQLPPGWKGKFNERLESLTDLGDLMMSDESAQNRAGILLSWLVKEHDTPSPTKQGFAGGDISSGYIQAQIIGTLARTNCAYGLTAVHANAQVRPIIKDAAAIALGVMGDRSQVHNLKQIIENSKHPEPYYRARAARSLGLLGAIETIPALENLLNDPFAVQAGNCVQGQYTAYPVRQAAESALRRLRINDELERARLRNEQFAAKLADERNRTDSTIDLDIDMYVE